MRIIIFIFFLLNTINLQAFEPDKSTYEYSLQLFEQGQNLRSITLLDYLSSKKITNEEFKFRIEIAKAVNLFHLGDTKESINVLDNIADKKIDVKNLKAFFSKDESSPVMILYQDEYLRERVELKSPWIAGTLSALVPGSGLVYTGHPQSAALTFALNAITLFATLELAQDNKKETAIASGAVFSMFYVGSIYASVQAANSKNENKNLDLKRKLQEKYFPLLFLKF